MKYILVSDDIGTPLYFDHPDGRMLCMPIPTTQDLMQHNFNESFSSMVCGKLVFVFQKYELLHFTIVSDQGESESFLRSQLKLVYEILMLVFGKTLHQKKNGVMKQLKFIQKLVDTMCWLTDRYQSFMAIQTIELVDVNDDIRNRCYDSLKKVMYHHPHAHHGFIFVGTKLLVSYTKPKLLELNPADIFLLIIYFLGNFHPKARQMEETPIPVANYTDHHNLISSSQPRSVQEDEKSEEFASATEDWEEDPKMDQDDQFLFLNNNNAMLFDELVNVMNDKFDNQIERCKMGLQNLLNVIGANIGDGKIISGTHHLKSLLDMSQNGIAEEQLEDPLVRYLLGCCGYEEKEKPIEFIQNFQEQYKLTTNRLDAATFKKLIFVAVQNTTMDQELSESEGGFDQETADEKSKMEEYESEIDDGPKKQFVTPSHTPNRFSLLEEELASSEVVMPVYARIFLRTPSYTSHWVYCAELESAVTLVIINKNVNANPADKEELNAIQTSLRRSLKNYLDYLVIKERTHLPILSYLHQLPGLVHFIFVDRTNNRIIAPTIGPLHGQQCNPNEETSRNMVWLLKQKVWELCYIAQQYLSNGYCSMLVKSGDFQYSYRLWVEDADGIEIPFESPIVYQSGTLIDQAFYRDLLKRLHGTKVYELYTITLGIASVYIVANHERKLIGYAKSALQKLVR